MKGKFVSYQHNKIDNMLPYFGSNTKEIEALRIVSKVFPFRVSSYVLDELIEWNRIPDDPIYRMVFPHKDMLSLANYTQIATLVAVGDNESLDALVRAIRLDMNPHPAGQMTVNVPVKSGIKLEGIQHKYNSTVLFFPSQGQSCHTYCSFCFRWAQFVGKDLRFSSNDQEILHNYLANNKEITDLLITGGDPMVMKANVLEKYLLPLLSDQRLRHIRTIRIGSKSLSFWPYRFINDADSESLLSLFRLLVQSGKHVSFMAHIGHWKEMKTDAFKMAVKNIQQTGVVLRSQAPLIAGLNDTPETWAQMWSEQVEMGIIPYYMFIERDTGAKHCFEVPLYKAVEIYKSALDSLTGLAKTVRGPSMSHYFGKIEVVGISEINGVKIFVLRFIQARKPEWTHKIFYARYSETATWFDELEPAFGEDSFFFEEKNINSFPLTMIRNKISEDSILAQ